MRTSSVPFSFVSSHETEKERLLFTCENVASGFYQRHGFLTSDKIIKNYEKWKVIIHDTLDVDQKFWQEAAEHGVDMNKVITKNMYKQTQDVELIPSSPQLVEHFKSEWQQYKTKFWQELTKVFPSEVRWIGSVEVRITKLGSLGTHYLLNKKKGEKLVINIREDAPIHEIANLIILSLIFPLTDKLGLTFTNRQTLRNFLMSRRPFIKLFPKFKSKLYNAKPKIPTSLRQKSNKYIKHLGIPNLIDPVKLINENIDIFGFKESKILKEFINKRGEVLTYDNIADLIWGEGNFKSYWAINKIIQRINTKIKSLNINFEIKGIRSVGYKSN